LVEKGEGGSGFERHRQKKVSILNTLAIIYAVNPVNEIANVNAGRLRTLGRYALGIAVEGQDQLKGKNYNPTFRAGGVTIYVKMDGWIDMYRLRFITG
jgi:hypothetical protein